MKKLTLLCALLALCAILIVPALAQETAEVAIELTQPVELGSYTVCIPDGFELGEDGAYTGMLGNSMASLMFAYSQSEEGDEEIFNTAAEAEAAMLTAIAEEADSEELVVASIVYAGECPVMLIRSVEQEGVPVAMDVLTFTVGREDLLVMVLAYGEDCAQQVAAFTDAVLATIVTPAYPG